MLHVSSVGDGWLKKDKIEAFLNMLLQYFRDAFYPGKDLSLDNMVVKWKGCYKFKMIIPINRSSII